ncbi:unnamed protein product [Schistosoma margrebowiei]|uniref:Uncharacterized protein n=1 Tax=Schistosoma margrebowiei TaxID=48269 RepID=A0A183LD04_9TREM|nr:unnamed protein product [Schistosoma margrebowiei]
MEIWNNYMTQRTNWWGNMSNSERPVKDKDGKPITEIQEQKNGCVEQLEELLNRPDSLTPLDIKAAHTDLPIDVTSPMIERIRIVMIQMKSRKAERPDNTSAEVLKSDIGQRLAKQGTHSYS